MLIIVTMFQTEDKMLMTGTVFQTEVMMLMIVTMLRLGMCDDCDDVETEDAVSYTHLTLPTIDDV